MVMEDPHNNGATIKVDEPEPKKSKQGPRKRVSQACDRCRSRKDKCDGKKPACSTCTSNGRQCAYDANVKKRGLPEGYVRGLEKLWGLAIREVPGVEDNILLVVTGGDGIERFIDVWNDESNSEALVDTWRKSQISRELEKLLSTPESPADNGKRKRTESDSYVEKRIGLGGTSSTSLEGPGSNRDVWPESKLETPSQDPQRFPKYYENNQFQERAPQESILSPQTQRAASSNPPTSITDAPELPSEAWHLLDVYFSYTHSWLPIIEKHDLLRTSYQYSQSRSKFSSLDQGSGDHAILWAAIAYAKFQHRAINNTPHAQGAVAEMVWTAERMYTHARSLIPTEEGIFELGHVQALLILALTYLGIGHLSRAWILIGNAVRVAIDLGLDKSSDDILAPLKSKSRDKHTILGCFALDTIIAARLGRRPHLRSEDVGPIGVLEEDGLEEWDPWTDCLTVRRTTGSARGPASILSTFNRLIQVLRILNDAICIPGGPKKVQLSNIVLEKLHIWTQAQPSSLHLDSAVRKGDQSTSLLPHHYNLHLSYFNTLVASQLMSYNHGNDIARLEPCIRSARQIAELLKQHSNQFGLLIAPPTFEYFTKTAYDVVREINGSIENTQVMLNDWKHNLDYCLEAMGPAWPVFESFKTSPDFQPNQPTPNGRRESQVAFDLINSMSQAADTPMTTGKTPNSLASFGIGSPQALRANQPHTRNTSQANAVMQSPISHRTPSFGQASGQILPATFQQSPQIIFDPQPGDLWPISNQTQLPTTMHPNLQHSMSFSSEFELDPTFQEFATLDATEWSNNWDQSLTNLGFTDPEHMNQDFYTMSREPDPLFAANNVFQQLVASSNAEATDFFDGPAFGIGVGDFGGLGFGEESEGIEAGQILQSLSAAEEQRGNG